MEGAVVHVTASSSSSSEVAAAASPSSCFYSCSCTFFLRTAPSLITVALAVVHSLDFSLPFCPNDRPQNVLSPRSQH